ncbi:AraC family transcriptional regulator [Marinobacter sp. NP-4(2019)]|uniref:helix-turn-helix transcriptional regulator n=1 Tax=Marinobacter sp. NP-4(2019) TaxID=2488665 RepID=UPI000FC3DA14|nr:helix-turn-helix transcriptional regulator [Marinobacter sp. NP-4(2019)]AZT85686.1 AraC family transcriptional regulator [Marinobacter sp. NP-4(2019)]
MSELHGSFPTRPFSAHDFLSFGRDYGIDYQFPTLSGLDRQSFNQPVAKGMVNEIVLPSGFRLTSSDLDVLQPYESLSLGHSPLLIVVVLQGRISLEVGCWQRELHPGMALSLQLGPTHRLHAVQLPGQRLKTVTLALDPHHLAEPSPHHALLTELLETSQQPVYSWRVPLGLLDSLRHHLEASLPELQRKLLLEGVALQLMALGLPGNSTLEPSHPGLSRQDVRRLESVRSLLEYAPAESYSLSDLAERAAMSPSSLRHKFRQLYGQTVFEYLRSRRLVLAKRCLEEGCTVQQAAHRAGYRHATNFATAFRRQFGVSPRNLGSS